jgi:hypothetical protein
MKNSSPLVLNGLRILFGTILFPTLASAGDGLVTVGPGGYADIDSAIQAVLADAGGGSDLDAILVASGSYPTFGVDGTNGGALSIIAEGQVLVGAGIDIRGGSIVTLRGIDVTRNLGGGPAIGIYEQSTVWIEDADILTNESIGDCDDDPAATIEVINSNLNLVRCEVTPFDGYHMAEEAPCPGSESLEASTPSSACGRVI